MGGPGRGGRVFGKGRRSEGGGGGPGGGRGSRGEAGLSKLNILFPSSILNSFT